MKTKDLRKVVAESIESEGELYDFCIECLNKIYGERATLAIHKFEEGVEYREWNGCIQSLDCIDKQMKHEENAIAKRVKPE